MFPGHRNMDPYTPLPPHLRECSPSTYHYYPNWEARPPHLKADSIKHPSAFEPWPYGDTVEHNCSYNPRYPPPLYYSTMPPYCPFQPLPQMYYHGPYPPYPDSYPPYSIPPPHYAADPASFGYDIERYHCCGCSNHVCHKQDGSSNLRVLKEMATPRIEEEHPTVKIVEEPEKGSKDTQDSLIRFPASHYPFQWLPFNQTREGKTEKDSQPSPTICFNDNIKDLQRSKDTQISLIRFPVSHYPFQWLPFNQTQEGKTEKDSQSSPTICFNDNIKDLQKGLGKNTSYGDDKLPEAIPISPEDWPSRFRRPPLKLLGNESSGDKVVEEPKVQNFSDGVAEKEKKIRTIPVVHVESTNAKPSMPAKSVDMDKLNKSVAGEKHNTTTENVSSQKKPSPPKTSKLPPVCLRLNPMPKKNGSNVKSRSPNSPVFEGKGKVTKDNNVQATNPKNITMINVADNTMPKVIEVIDVKDKSSAEGSNGAIVFGEDMKGTVEKFGYKDKENVVGLHKEKIDSSDNKIETNKVERTNLSPEEAALHIQSAYRGFSVRRWQPLEKLRKIDHIRGKTAAVKNQIQNYEDSEELDAKGKVVISETIMELLLQLDAIQGLLPSLREVRKSAVKELVFLEDKLDQLYNKAMDENQEGSDKQDECCSPIPEAVFPASASYLNDNSLLIEQPSISSGEENVLVREIEESLLASEQKKPAFFDKTACTLEQDEVKEVADVPPVTKHDQTEQGNGEMLSDAGEVMVEKFINENIVSHPHEGEVSIVILKQQSEEDESSHCKDLLTKSEVDIVSEDKAEDGGHPDLSVAVDENGRQADLSFAGEVSMAEKSVNKDDVLHPCEGEVANFVLEEKDQYSYTTEPLSNEFKFEQKPFAEEVMAVEPDGGNKEPLFEDLKEHLEGDVTIRNGEEIMEESSKTVTCGEMKSGFFLADDVGPAKDLQHEPELSIAMNPIGDVDDTVSRAESVATFPESCTIQNQSEGSSEIPGNADSLKLPSPIEFSNRNGRDVFVEAPVNKNKLLEKNDWVVVPGNNSTEDIGHAGNSTDSIPETSACMDHEKPVSSDSFNDELNLKEKKVMEENAELRKMLKRFLLAGQEQMGVISDLNCRVKSLERQLSRKKKVKVNLNRASKPFHS